MNWTSIKTLPVLALLALPAKGTEMTPFDTKLEDEGFERIAKDKGVKVYKHKTSEVIRLAAEGRIASPPEKVMQALLDYEAQKGVIKRVSESRIIERGPGWVMVYQHLNLPVISDRDYTLYVKWGADGKNLWVRYSALRHAGREERDGIVRVTNHEGSWQLKPILGGTATYVRFQTRIDLAGWLPKWMARSGAGDELPELFENIRFLMVKRNQEVAS